MLAKSIHSFEHPLLLMAVICLFLVTYAVNVATHKKRHQNLGLYALIIFTAIAGLAAYHANKLFAGMDNMPLYRDFCTYLCSELLSAVIILFGFTVANFLVRVMSCGEALMVTVTTLVCGAGIVWVMSSGPAPKVDKLVVGFVSDLIQRYCLDDILIGLSVGSVLYITGVNAAVGIRRLIFCSVVLVLILIAADFGLWIYRLGIPLYIFYQLMPIGALSVLAAVAGGILAIIVDAADSYSVFITVVAITSMTLYGIFSNIQFLGLQPVVMITVEMLGAIVTTLLIEETVLSR